MLDDLNPRTGLEREGRTRPTTDEQVRPLVDREVPLGQQADRPIAAAVHAWLDGELPEASVRKNEGGREVEFWRNLDSEMMRVRRMRTPPHVEAQIMAALPTHAPAAVITPWYRREFVITPMAAVAVGAALIAAASIVTALLVR
ncbi:MAG TPA: hypothetical protein VG818_09825 [Gemmatimonadaceae bacterium]|jgi:hypothetical protein|nr:hypothetical protein [Gemmatimonadaceae bacterium]